MDLAFPMAPSRPTIPSPRRPGVLRHHRKVERQPLLDGVEQVFGCSGRGGGVEGVGVLRAHRCSPLRNHCVRLAGDVHRGVDREIARSSEDSVAWYETVEWTRSTSNSCYVFIRCICSRISAAEALPWSTNIAILKLELPWKMLYPMLRWSTFACLPLKSSVTTTSPTGRK